MKVPLLDLAGQHDAIQGELNDSVQRVIASGRYIMGPEVATFEDELATYCHSPFAVTCASGSDALILALMAAGVGAGDGVITTPYTFFATAGAIARIGAVPIFVDITADTYNIDPAQVEALLAGRSAVHSSSRVTTVPVDRIKAIIPVHLYGQMADMTALMPIAKQYGLTVIEDAAQAIGSERDGKRAGTVGDIGCFSFFPSKNLGCFGDGGSLTTADADLAERLRILRMHGGKPKYYHRVVGCNSRLDAMQAAVLRVKLPHLDSWTAQRQKNAAYYDQALPAQGLTADYVTTPVVASSARHIYNQYVVAVQRRDELREWFAKNEVGVEVYYPVPLHLQDCFADLGYQVGDFPVSEASAQNTVALPVYPGITTEQQDYVVQTMKAFYL